MSLSPQDRDVAHLCDCLRRKWEDLVDTLEEDHNPPIFLSTIETLRQPDRQAYYLKHGVSWTKNSKHLPQPPEKKSLAIDICPVAYLTMKGWNPAGALWGVVGEEGERLGLRWGGRWKQKDLAHLELEACECRK